MFISKVTIKRGPELFRLLENGNHNVGYVAHQILWNLFPNDGYMKRDFLFCKHEKTDLPQFLVVSKDMPVVTGGVLVSTKQYDPQLVKGQRLVFSLTANPVVSRKEEGKKRSIKHDVWMDAKRKAMNNGANREDIYKTCEEASKRWLREQGRKRGFILNEHEFEIDGYIKNRIYKKRQDNPIVFSSINYQGVLTVSDTEKFLSTLYEGIGRSKAFGCGLMLVKKID